MGGGSGYAVGISVGWRSRGRRGDAGTPDGDVYGAEDWAIDFAGRGELRADRGARNWNAGSVGGGDWERDDSLGGARGVCRIAADTGGGRAQGNVWPRAAGGGVGGQEWGGDFGSEGGAARRGRIADARDCRADFENCCGGATGIYDGAAGGYRCGNDWGGGG